MRILASLVLAAFLMTSGGAVMAAAPPAVVAATLKADGKIATWTKTSFSLKPATGKAWTFLMNKDTKVVGKAAVGAKASVGYTKDKAGKMWATTVTVK
jgi:hypothetical protein